MKKQSVTEEMGVHEEWYEQAKKMTADELPKFINHLMNDYGHDYGTICHAITAGGIATMWAMNNCEQGGITGFQAGAIMWEFIGRWNNSGNKTGMRLVDYDNMLYPQYKQKFEKIISKETWDELQKEAGSILKEGRQIHASVKSHLEKIVSGKVPFGYSVSDEE